MTAASVVRVGLDIMADSTPAVLVPGGQFKKGTAEAAVTRTTER
jgi:hypothetical protein